MARFTFDIKEQQAQPSQLPHAPVWVVVLTALFGLIALITITVIALNIFDPDVLARLPR